MNNTVKSILKTVATVLLLVIGFVAASIYVYTNSYGAPSHLMFLIFIFSAMGADYLLYSFCKGISGKLGKALRVFFVLLFCLTGFCGGVYFVMVYYAPLRMMLG